MKYKYAGIVKLLDVKCVTRGDYHEKHGGLATPTKENVSDRGYQYMTLDYGIAWMRQQEFENTFTNIHNLSFSLALDFLINSSAKIARQSWNGKNMYVYYVPENTYPCTTRVAKDEFGEYANYNAYFALKQADDTVSVWTPSVGDLLATDWRVVE